MRRGIQLITEWLCVASIAMVGAYCCQPKPGSPDAPGGADANDGAVTVSSFGGTGHVTLEIFGQRVHVELRGEGMPDGSAWDGCPSAKIEALGAVFEGTLPQASAACREKYKVLFGLPAQDPQTSTDASM